MATLVKFHDFKVQLGKGIHNLDTDTHRLFLAAAGAGSPDADADAVLTDLGTLIATTNISGAAFPQITTQFTEVTAGTGIGTFAGDQVTVTASGGTVATFRYYGIYNDTATSPADALICYWDHGSDVSLADGETFIVTFGADATMGTILTVD